MYKFSHVEKNAQKCRSICFRNLSRSVRFPRALKMNMIYLLLNTLKHLIKTAQPNSFLAVLSNQRATTSRYKFLLSNLAECHRKFSAAKTSFFRIFAMHVWICWCWWKSDFDLERGIWREMCLIMIHLKVWLAENPRRRRQAWDDWFHYAHTQLMLRIIGFVQSSAKVKLIFTCTAPEKKQEKMLLISSTFWLSDPEQKECACLWKCFCWGWQETFLAYFMNIVCLCPRLQLK